MITIAITIFALLLRLINLNQSFWLDEAASLVISKSSIIELLGYLKGDFHPPIFYLLLNQVLNLRLKSEWTIRLPFVILSTLTVPVVYLITETVTSKKTIINFKGHHFKYSHLAALLLAVNPLHIYYSQELRMYGLYVLLISISWLSLLKNLKKFYLAVFIFSTIASLYTFYGAFFNIISQFVYVLLLNKKNIKSFFISLAISLVAFMPWIPTLSRQLENSSAIRTLAGWDQISGDLSFKSLALIYLKIILGRINLDTSIPHLAASLIFVFYISSILFLSVRKKTLAFVIWITFSMLPAIIISLKTPVLGYWRHLNLIPPFIILLTLGSSYISKRLRKISILITSISFIFLFLLHLFNPSNHREDWKGATSFIKERVAQNSLVVFAFSDAFAPVYWYQPDLEFVAPLNDLNQQEYLDQTMTNKTRGKSQLYYFEYLSDLTDRNRDIELWITNSGFQKTNSYNFNGVGLIHLYQGLQP